MRKGAFAFNLDFARFDSGSPPMWGTMMLPDLFMTARRYFSYRDFSPANLALTKAQRIIDSGEGSLFRGMNGAALPVAKAVLPRKHNAPPKGKGAGQP